MADSFEDQLARAIQDFRPERVTVEGFIPRDFLKLYAQCERYYAVEERLRLRRKGVEDVGGLGQCELLDALDKERIVVRLRRRVGSLIREPQGVGIKYRELDETEEISLSPVELTCNANGYEFLGTHERRVPPSAHSAPASEVVTYVVDMSADGEATLTT